MKIWWIMSGMAHHTKKNRAFYICLFVLTATVAWACSDLGYIGPSSSYSEYGGNRNCDGCSKFHGGFDLSPDNGKAMHGGMVEVGWMNGYGNVVTVTNGNFKTVYAHACTVDQNLNGQIVGAGQSLGDWTSCCTGNCSSSQIDPSTGKPGVCSNTQTGDNCQWGKHVHYETQVKNSANEWKNVDPAIVSEMINEGRNPCDPSFADEAVQRTEEKHGRLAGGYGADGGTNPAPNPNPNPNPDPDDTDAEPTPVPGQNNLCV